MNIPARGITADDVVFNPLSANEWRVSDRRFPRESIEALLGFVAQKGARFYATRMNHPLEASSFGSLELVARFFANADESVARSLSTRQVLADR